MANTSIKAAFERMWAHIVLALSNKVDLTSEETISGVKTFSNGMIVGEIELMHDNAENALVISFPDDTTA